MLLLGLLLVIIASVRSDDPCPQTYEYRTEFNRCIRVFSASVDFWTADSQCRLGGGHLIAIHNAFINSLISNLITQYVQGAQTWIGVYRNSSSGDFYWTDNSDVDFSGWNSHNPFAGDHAAYFDGAGWSSGNPVETHPYVCENKPKFIPCKNATVNACATGWTVNTEIKSCYKVGHRKSFSGAVAECKRSNAVLSNIENQMEYEFLKDLTATGIVGGIEHNFWLEGNSKASMNWARGTVPVQQSSPFSSDSCSSIFTAPESETTVLVSRECTDVLRSFVCKKSIFSH